MLETEIKEYVGQWCTVGYDVVRGGEQCGFGITNGIVVNITDEELVIVYGHRVPHTKVIHRSTITSIEIRPPYDLEQHGLRMEDVVGDTPEEQLCGRIGVVHSWAEAARRAGDRGVAAWHDSVADKMEDMSWLIQISQ